jgi:ABC-type glycerol-3-phosphate transport system substrate-binding protein
MSKFQLALLGIFGLFIFIGVLVFALYRGGGSGSQDIRAVVWGTLPSQEFNSLLASTAFPQDESLRIEYIEKSPNRIEAEFTEALAQGKGPDLIIFRQDQYWKNKEKLMPIPYQSVSIRDFQDTFIEAGEIYLQEDGLYALPLISDPLVLYYNRDMLSAAGIAKPIAYWDEIYNSIGNLSRRDAAGNLVKSAVALGEVRNISNAKDILSLLLLQAGNPITGTANDTLQSYLLESFGMTVAPAEAALEFYTQFANPTKSFYSWSRILPEAQTRFASGDLAYYIGFASELRAIRGKNPTLNFSVAPVPQSRVSGKTLTTGRLYGVSLSRGTKNPQGALTAALKLISRESGTSLSGLTLLPPARRDLLSALPSDSIQPVFYSAALQSKSWIDPDSALTTKIFSDMIEAVTSGRARLSEALSEADRQLEVVITN